MPTLHNLTTEWANTRAPYIRERTLTEYLRLLHHAPFRREPADTITRHAIATHLETLTPAIARHTRAALSACYKWAIATGRLTTDPTAGLRVPRHQSRTRVLDLAEMRQIWRCRPSDDFGRIVGLLLLTAARRSEIGSLAWSEIKADRMAIPAARCKNNRPHHIPLTPQTAALLPPHRPGRTFCFGRRRASGFSGWSQAKATLDKTCPIAPWTLHDIRRGLATYWVENDMADPDLAELIPALPLLDAPKPVFENTTADVGLA